MKEHRFVAFTASARFDESGATALDLNTATSLLLDVLHISTALSDDLSAQVEAGDGLKIDGDTLIRPFALYEVSQIIILTKRKGIVPYTAILIPLNLLLGFPAAEASLVDQVRKFFLHQVINHRDCFLQTILIGAGHMEVQGRALNQNNQHLISPTFRGIPYRGSRHVLVGVIVASGCHILREKTVSEIFFA